MLEEISDRERYGISGAFAVSMLVAFGAGTLVSGPTGAFTADSADTAQLEQRVQSLMDRQTEQQRQQLQQVANRSENLTMEDLSIDSKVKSVSRSQFDSLYRAEISTTGEVPNRLGSGTRSLDETQVVYISGDGRYLFQQPTDLEQPRQETGTGGR